jgi:hypothetical protein
VFDQNVPDWGKKFANLVKIANKEKITASSKYKITNITSLGGASFTGRFWKKFALNRRSWFCTTGRFDEAVSAVIYGQIGVKCKFVNAS